MHDTDTRPQPHDILAAFGLLTRLPLPLDHARAGARGAAAGWAWPLVGLVLGAAAGAVGWALSALGLPGGLAAAGALAVLVLATGALHEDGLADCADGMGGGKNRARALEIMRDSRIGAYGAVALVLALLARWSGLGQLSGWDWIAICATVGAASRLAMLAVMTLLPNARGDGLSAATGRPAGSTLAMAGGITLVAALVLTGWPALLALVVMALAAGALAAQAQRNLGGQTGDVLGGAQQCAEIAGLAVFSAMLA